MSISQLLDHWIPGLNPSRRAKENHRPVNITADIKSVIVRHKKHNLLIKRNQNNDARINDMYAKTSRPCPPFCIQPMNAAPGVETIAELEMLDYLSQTTDESNNSLIIDSRMKKWFVRGAIPCAINIPWTQLVPSQGATPQRIMKIMRSPFQVSFSEELDGIEAGKAILDESIAQYCDFTSAKTLVIYCNGPWCSQTSESIKSLLRLGYPAEKIKYFRNGMQGWESLGLTTIAEKDEKPIECKLK